MLISERQQIQYKCIKLVENECEYHFKKKITRLRNLYIRVTYNNFTFIRFYSPRMPLNETHKLIPERVHFVIFMLRKFHSFLDSRKEPNFHGHK